MPRPGGEADKVGNRYESFWTMLCLLDILDGKAESITLEPLGPEGEGVEFTLKRPGGTEYYQVKSSAGVGQRWTIPLDKFDYFAGNRLVDFVFGKGVRRATRLGPLKDPADVSSGQAD